MVCRLHRLTRENFATLLFGSNPAAINPAKPGLGSLELLSGSLPKTKVPDDTNLKAVANSVLKTFPGLEEHPFTDDALWRDTYALTGTIRTLYFGASVAAEWNTLSESHEVSSATLVPSSTNAISVDADSSWIDCRITFSSSHPAAECYGIFSLVLSKDCSWRIWFMRTILEQLNIPGGSDLLKPSNSLIKGHTNGKNYSSSNTSNGHFKRNRLPKTLQQHILNLISRRWAMWLKHWRRLQALGVSYVRSRYESARLHTVRETNLPLNRTFGPEYSDYLGKDELAKGHKQWAEKYDINIWLSKTVESGCWDEVVGVYTLNTCKDRRSLQITTKHVVMATGAGSQSPLMPNGRFKGDLLHSADYSLAQVWAGKSGIVIGTANTAHDAAGDMYEAGMQVTMVQRSRTFVLPVEFIKNRYDVLYNNKILTEISDRGMISNPVSIARRFSAKTFHTITRAQPERHESLERAGFKVDPFSDIQDAINIRLGGHYIEVGASAKIGKRLIKANSGAAAVRCTENGLVFSDGTEVKADVIVFAAGFIGNLRHHVEKIFGSEIAKKVGTCFGINPECEVLRAFKPLEQPGLWYIGGALGHARYYSRFIALSIKADDIGTPLPVYHDYQYLAH
ncbi:dimethylaniline monooxygenase (N-oxide forming) [Ilyonectria robusta]|uniref:dimethylaniline monooxygenase (N-oxide forming) n=1 Tax=Ilyonectria robusta TaxID=1079257 RepID=UPI001E8CE858|nr:dimethylaniline monooxygenase (N-oxide forming) [Ilyonectria robusta]KAH8665515.1 dimethylaniline monooxygenase (N-oxide forming) [Ilyonectria robusta]